MISKRFTSICVLFFLIGFSSLKATETIAEETDKQEEGFDFGELLMHHVKDAYTWHFFTLGNVDATIYLPIIAYKNGDGLDVFSSRKISDGNTYHNYKIEEGHLVRQDGMKFLDFSITKVAASIMVSAILLLFIFIGVARKYKGKEKKAPHGFQAFIEPLILFIRDDVAKPILGERTYFYLPYLLSIFFFIWINNMMGLLPGAANVTGNIAITCTLAIFTMLVVNVSGNKHYWMEIFAPPGIPLWLLPIMWIVEIMGIFTKPFALMVRLFANMISGHMIILSILGLIFLFAELSAGLGWGIAIFSVAMSTFMLSLDLLVAALQAYIFTILSALFIGLAVQDAHN